MPKRAQAAKEILNLRKALGQTQLQFANQLETTPTTVSRWERGISPPSWDLHLKMLRLADENGVARPEFELEEPD